MIQEIIYIVRVMANDELEGIIQEDYTVSAKDRQTAKKIGQTIFNINHGDVPNLKIGVKYANLNDREIEELQDIISTEFNLVKDSFTGLNYKEFLQTYQNMRGYYMDLNMRGFWFKFNRFKIHLVYGQTGSAIDDEEIYIRNNGREYLIKDYFTQYLISRE